MRGTRLPHPARPAPGSLPPWGAAQAALCRLAVGIGEVFLHPLARLFCLRGRLRSGPLFRSERGRDRLAQCMLHMEEIGRVMRSKVVFHIRQQAWGLITGRLHHPAVETRKSWRHQRIPRVLIACLGHLFQENVVALGVHPHQAQTARQRFIPRHRHVFGRHLVCQTSAFLMAVCHDRLLHATIDLLLGPIRRPHKPVESRQLQQQTDQANPACANLDTHKV